MKPGSGPVAISRDDLERLVRLAYEAKQIVPYGDGEEVLEDALTSADRGWLRDLIRKHGLPTTVIP